MASEGKGRLELLTAEATARTLGVSRKTLYRLVASKALTPVRIRGSRAWHDQQPRTSRTLLRFATSEVERLLVASYDGGSVPTALLRRLRRLAKSYPVPPCT